MTRSNRRRRPPEASPADWQLAVLGVDFATAPLAVREGLSYDPPAARALLEGARTIPGLREAAIVSTCNRTEFYVVSTRGTSAAAALLQQVRRERPGAAPHGADCALVRLDGDDAAERLLRVACGLESAILGDTFIVRQLKTALGIASGAGTLGPVLSRLFQQAFTAGHRARRDSDIARGEASVGGVIAGLVASRGPGQRVLVLGAGEAARDIARQCAKRAVTALAIANRTRAKAEALAQACGGTVVDWTDRAQALTVSDVVIAATAAPTPVVDAGLLGSTRADTLLIDVCVPRNLAPRPDRQTLTIDDLAKRRADAAERRRDAVPAVRAIVAEELRRWRDWRRAQPVEQLLKRMFAEVSQRQADLVRELAGSGWTRPEDGAGRLIAKSMRSVLKSHAADLREWAAHMAGGD